MTTKNQNPEFWMSRAVRLSRKGFPAPNPHVGCVIVQDGILVGEGFHDHAGGPHAEVVALQSAGSRAKGADVYVTLEPCNHHGRTPPCSQALINAGVRRVFVACDDPNPGATGGTETLRNAGIQIESGILAAQANAVNFRWLQSFALNRPYVVLKLATTLDGKVAHPDGASKWITSEATLRKAHRLRAELGAVLVGANTARRDDPLLTARIPGVINQPARIVIDPSRSLPDSLQLFNGALPTLRVTCVDRAQSGDLGVADQHGELDLADLLNALFSRGIRGLLVEGGPYTAAAFRSADLVDEIQLMIAPTQFGEGISAFPDCPTAAKEWRLESTQRSGPDVTLRFIRIRK